jgi:hypothetical protein
MSAPAAAPATAPVPTMMSSIKLADDGTIEIVNQLLLPSVPLSPARARAL